MTIQLQSGMKAYTKALSLHIGPNELIYRAPWGTKFAVIFMLAEKPDNEAGIAANDYLRSCGWNESQSHLGELQTNIQSEIGDFFAGFGGPGEPESPEEAQALLISRIDALFRAV
ncbi:hypothetical protein KC222_00575 [Cedecea davisae]|uniref:Uncharacterized protein n=1 Tax=Cedecea davisae TaxID=158484 RepID=A0ABS6DCE6_9ENTR|nr:hypothetical protein [Cedecea davisae]MBU4680506.1 hypothetical protein [Cedecea davisae]MBU4684998.1 hypothetical protein [Cedecea davisae]